MIFIFFHIHSSIFMFTLHYFIMEFIFFSLKWAFIGFGRKTWRKKEKGGREGELRKKGRGKGKEGKREEKRRGGRGKGKNDQSRLNKKQCQKGLKKTQELEVDVLRAPKRSIILLKAKKFLQKPVKLPVF